MEEREAIRQAAEDLDEIKAERRSRGRTAKAKGDRAGGSSAAPAGAPKGDVVAGPDSGLDASARAD